MKMASTLARLLQRDSDSGTNGNLTTGAIAGIACGAGALFLGAAGLFLIYWRRQRQYDEEDNYYHNNFDGMGPQGGMAPALTYTMDYKMEHQHHEGDQGSAYTYSPEKAASFSPAGAFDTASAMPTHPAYIPRALVRGTPPSSHRSTITTTVTTTTAATSPPPQFPSPPLPSSSSKTQPDDAVIQAYLNAATSAPHANLQDTAHESDASQTGTTSGGLPTHPRGRGTSTSPAQMPVLVMPSFASPTSTTTSATTTSGPARKKPRTYLPPRLNLALPSPPAGTGTGPGSGSGGDKPLHGRRGDQHHTTTISGPLAFPEHSHHRHPGGAGGAVAAGWRREDGGDGDGATTDTGGGGGGGGGGETPGKSDRRTFRGRAFGKEKDKDKDKKKKEKKEKRKKAERNSGNRYYAEIEIGRGSDIW